MNMLGRVMRRAAVRVVASVVRRARLVGFLVVAGGGLLIASALNLLPFNVVATSAPASETYRQVDGEPAAIASYIKGMQLGDARLMWENYSDRGARLLLRRGFTIQETQLQLDRARESEERILQVDYVGNRPIPNGSLHFYVIVRSGPGASRFPMQDVAYTPYVFTLDAQGKIDRTE